MPGVYSFAGLISSRLDATTSAKRPAGVDNSEILLPEVVLKLLVKNRRRGI